MMLLLSAPYMHRAALFLLCVALTGAVLSVVVNLRGMEFSVEALVHSVFPGIVVGLAVAGLPGILPGAALAALLTVLVLARLDTRADHEAGTAVVLTLMYGIGVLISLKVGDRSGQLEALMFGRLLDVTATRIAPSLALCAVAALLILATWRAQLAVAFDREAARVTGLRVNWVDLGANIAVGIFVVAASSAIGVLLVLGFVVIPGLVGRLLARSAETMAAWALLSALAAVAAGLWLMLSFHQVSPQAAVVLVLALSVPLALVGRRAWVS
ncbi:metal ABC transporter permease [Corynebacterium sp.]|uniref:metal ABC transporter permease n=1 Tax=Corynebacterium sp. TaxID=1720 RepID=UPI0026DDCC0F|nr:metal ABC transporter permease [Corynebacterium sp.]MDO5032398.1 metal ABC transporter permease [Corynebacterium sp.]